MNTFRKYSSKFISILFAIMMVVVLLSVIFADGGYFSMNNSNLFLSICIGVAFALGVFLLYHKLFRKTSEISRKWEIIIVVSAIVIFLILGIVVIFTLRVKPGWDFGHIYNAALNLANHGDFGEAYTYISNFPFQLFLVGMFSIVIKLTSGILPASDALIYLNLLFILMTIGLFYLIIRKMFDVKKAIFSLFMFIVFSPIILYTPIFYSDTISMFFVMLCFYLALFLCDEAITIRKRIILSLLFGLSLLCGFEIKATVLILAIAVLLFVLFIKKKVSVKNATISIVCVATVFLPLSYLISTKSQQLTNRDMEIPKTHWVMMGLRNYGGFNMEDYSEITFKALDEGRQQELKDIHIEEIKNRLGNYGVFGYLNFLTKKLSYTWGDGTYYVSDKLSREPSNPDSWIYKFVAKDGEYFQIYSTFMNGMQFMLLLVICIGALLTVKDRSEFAIIKLAIMGVIIFFLLWEARSRYLINYLPLLFVLFVYSLDNISICVQRFSQLRSEGELCSQHKSSQYTRRLGRAKPSAARPKSKSNK